MIVGMALGLYSLIVSGLYALVAEIAPLAADKLIVAFIALLLAPAICAERRRIHARRRCVRRG